MPASPLPNPFDTLSGRIIITTFHSLAIIITLYRIFRRVHIKRFSGDDWLASLALFLMGFYVASDWIRYGKMNANPPPVNSDYNVVLLKINMSLSYFIVWCCRASLALSITRILPPGRRKTMSIVLAITSLLTGPLLAISVQTLCTIDMNWKRGVRFFHCKGGDTLTIASTSSDIVSSIFLITLVLHCIWKASDLGQRERRLLMILFGSTLLALIPSVVRALYVIKQYPTAITYASKLQVATSLMICNLVVVATRVYQVLFRRRGNESSTDSETSPPPTITQSSKTHTHREDTHGTTSTGTSDKSDFAQFTQASDMYSLQTDNIPHGARITQIEVAHLREARGLRSLSRGQG